jgi:predicted ATPase with chaperone activity
MDDSPGFKTASLATPLVVPESLSDVGVRRTFLEELLLKILYLSGPLSVREWADLSRLSSPVIDELFRRLRKEQLCEVIGMVAGLSQVAITSQGRSRALELLSLNQYAGPAPVSFESYVQQVRRQSVRNIEVHPPSLQHVFAHLVLDNETLTRLGTALNSGGSLFLYGPTGSGKTTLAQALPQVLAQDEVWIPFAVEIDGQVITVYDPLIHKSTNTSGVARSDPRWMICQRPAVVVGGELTIDMLDLQFNPITKYYAGPVQMKANNGVLIIDDFGRQRARPEELLNRWVVPLDRRIDFLTLTGGKKVEIPFELLVVFATNMEPAELVDAAFLRRIQTKVRVDNASEQQFREIFRRTAESYHLEYEPEILDSLLDMLQNKLKEPLRRCYPRDILNQVRWAARYEGKEPKLTRETLMHAVDAYFLTPDRETEDANR